MNIIECQILKIQSKLFGIESWIRFEAEIG